MYVICYSSSCRLSFTPLSQGKSFEENNVPSPAPSVVASDMCFSQDSAPTEKLPSASGDIASCIDSRMVVLLVDDEKLPRTVGSRLVRSLGWQCVTAMSGMDALQKLETSLADSEQHIFDVILMDYQVSITQKDSQPYAV